MLKNSFACSVLVFFAAGALSLPNRASAQTVAYRSTNLASDVDVPGFANQVNMRLQNTWGVAFLPGQPFFITNTGNGQVTTHDATGSSTRPGSFTVPGPAASGSDAPTGIVADANSFFGGRSFVQPFVLATQRGQIFLWGPDANGDLPAEATLALDHEPSGAVYTAVAILTPDCCAAFLAVANFHTGAVEPYTTTLSPLAPPGSFTDPTLPVGYAPYGMQVIDGQLFITYALQDPAKRDPIFGAGNGIVSLFDLAGNFVRRFATGGLLNAPWGITRASPTFGPFSGDILIGNVGDGTINAFDPATGILVGQLQDGDGNVLANQGLHALTFRPDEFGGDRNTLYFTAGINGGQDGLFGAIEAGLMSSTRVSAQFTAADNRARFTATVAADPGNVGIPTGTVVFLDGSVPKGTVPLINGVATLDATLTSTGTHVIAARFSGDAAFLPSSSQTEVQVTGAPTTLILNAPTNDAPGAAIALTAAVTSEGGTPTGQILFFDGNSGLGAAPIDDSGIAILRVDTLAAGVHSLVASYPGDEKFSAGTSAPVTLTIASRDFALGAAPLTATVTAGQSALFNVSVTPAGGFADPVAFSCSALLGITCSFDPIMVTPNGGVAATRLTVTTSADVAHFGQTFGAAGPGLFLASLGLIGTLILQARTTPGTHGAFLRVAASALCAVTLALTLVSCGGLVAKPPINRGVVSIVVTAQSGGLSHTTNVSLTVQ